MSSLTPQSKDVHFRCRYVGRGFFCIRLLVKEKKVEQKFTEEELDTFTNAIDVTTQRFLMETVRLEMSHARLARIKEYLELVLSTYRQAVAKGIDQDQLLDLGKSENN